ncbi:lysozyme [Brucella pseudogrignonensis]|uniref:lysozyme n=1 Tax=Brucella pseudogrignonensis TaxID=419475 RepID=UPI0028B863E3|nr:lysozyme [Brucella pseudogrignonensis]MDT6941951.1 lysozyme [Brucella pseudogrignonensis]MDT6942582.1 lysozyme [Brucella pseudogrignonensis]MDT6942624.1 lysozyme [Brucella pseudogrignonensis]
MARRINAAGLSLIQQWEGLKLTAYKDVAGIWTIGYGHTSAAGSPTVTPGMTITKAEASRILQNDLAKFEARVERLVKVPLTDNQFAVLSSFDYNTGALHKSTLLKKLNKGDYDAVPGELAKWVNAGGKKVQGLVNRRAAEAGLWAKGAFVSSNTVTATTKANKTDVATIGGTGAAGAAATVGPVIPEIVSTISNQQDELSSGQWVRVAIAAVIVGLTLWGIYRKIKS